MNIKKELIVKTEDGIELDGLLETPDTVSNQCLILCHGLSVDKEELGVFTKFVPMLLEAGYHVFRFDFRGHGKSTRQEGLEYTVTGSLKDLTVVIDFLKKQGYKHFLILAASFSGGAVAMYSGNNPDGLEALIMWNSLIDYDEKINPTSERNKKSWGQAAKEQISEQGYIQRGRGFKFSKEAFEELYHLKPYEELIKFKKPTLFIHGDKDQHVRYEDSKKYAGMMDKAEMFTIKDAPHGFQIEADGDMARAKALEFIKNNFKLL